MTSCRAFVRLPFLILGIALASPVGVQADFDPQIGRPGSLGIAVGSSVFVGWADSLVAINRGPQNIANPNGPFASAGDPQSVLGGSSGLVSLGDGGSITLGFTTPIADGSGADFAVFENGFLSGATGLAFLELAFVEVSSNGTDYFRFAATSLTPTLSQVGGFGPLDARHLNNLAGKYIAGYGTGFDLEELRGVSPLLDVNHVIRVRIIDVVGAIDPRLGSRDSHGNLINDPFTTPFASGGFDLTGVGVIHRAVPEPASLALVAAGLIGLAAFGGFRSRTAA